MMILELENIVKTYPDVTALDDVSLSIAQGDNVAIIGESGCGKTTLAKIIVGLIKPDAGQVRFEPNSAQMVFQDPYNSLDPLWCVHSILNEALHRQRHMPLVDRNEKVWQVLASVGLDKQVLHRFPHEFSGGERQRIAIARALLASPKVLVLDEALSALDTLVQRQIIQLLIRLRKEFHLTYIFISHNLRVVRHFSDKIIVMQLGKIIEQGPGNAILKNPTHPYTRQLCAAAFNYTSIL